jgi:hypothetical protein
MPEEKDAQLISDDMDYGKILTIMAISAAAAPAIEKGVGSLVSKVEEHSRRGREDESWLRLISKYPDLAANDYQKNRELFATLHALFPKIADRPEAIVGAIRIAQDYSTQGIDPSTLGSLSKIQSELSGKGPATGSTFQGMKALMDTVTNAQNWGTV